MKSISEFSDYLIFVDESGDHGLKSIDPEFPIFALVFVIIKKTDYLDKVVPAFQNLKMKYWGHDQIIFHENDLRKEKGSFSVLRTDASIRLNFMTELTEIIKSLPFKFVASVIRKDKLVAQYSNPYNPYQIGLLFCMEKTMEVLLSKDQAGKQTHILIEARGNKEDKDLELEFRRICDIQGNWGYKSADFKNLPFHMIHVDKKSNSSGLQLADLIARPIALKYLRPLQENKTHQILHEKIADIKCFPS